MKAILNHPRKYRIIFAVILLLIFAVAVPLASATSRGYATDDKELRPGMVVALSEDGSAQQPKVERAALEKESKVIGVSVLASETGVSVGSAQNTVYVQNTGEATVFVSDLNGEVKKGDLLAPSPLLGILMKADESTAPVVGIAIDDFDAETAQQTKIEENKQEKEVNINKININLDHMAASNQQASATDSSLERLGRAVVGRDVGEIQVLAALVIFVIVLVAEGSIIYGAVSSAITSLGRNPMAKKIIQKGLFRVVITAFMVLGVGVVAIYVILWI